MSRELFDKWWRDWRTLCDGEVAILDDDSFLSKEGCYELWQARDAEVEALKVSLIKANVEIVRLRELCREWQHLASSTLDDLRGVKEHLIP